MSEENGLSAAQRGALAGVLDVVIPPGADGRMPGAGELGLAEDLGARADLQPLLEAGLASLEAAAREAGAEGFLAVEPGERRGLVERAGEANPVFLPAVVAQTLVAYYQHPRVLEALGMEPRPPFPLGYQVEPTDFSILDPVRAKQPFYREP